MQNIHKFETISLYNTDMLIFIKEFSYNVIKEFSYNE